MKTEHIPKTWTIEKRGRRQYVFDDTGKARCGAINAKKTPCMKPPAKGHCRCNTHGAKNKAGKDNVSYKHGAYVGRYTMPRSLNDRHEEMQNDPQLLDLRNNIGIIDSRLQQLLDKIENADFGEAVLPQLNRLYYRAERHLRNRDMDEFAAVWIEIGDMIRRGQQDYLTWQELIKVNGERGKMTKQVVDMELAAHRAVSLNELMYVINRLIDSFENTNTIEDEAKRKELFTVSIRALLNEVS